MEPTQVQKPSEGKIEHHPKPIQGRWLTPEVAGVAAAIALGLVLCLAVGLSYTPSDSASPTTGERILSTLTFGRFGQSSSDKNVLQRKIEEAASSFGTGAQEKAGKMQQYASDKAQSWKEKAREAASSLPGFSSDSGILDSVKQTAQHAKEKLMGHSFSDDTISSDTLQSIKSAGYSTLGQLKQAAYDGVQGAQDLLLRILPQGSVTKLQSMGYKTVDDLKGAAAKGDQQARQWISDHLGIDQATESGQGTGMGLFSSKKSSEDEARQKAQENKKAIQDAAHSADERIKEVVGHARGL
jgi:hypothetical protein